jgi:uncharacterized protein (TIGR02996 family)
MPRKPPPTVGEQLLRGVFEHPEDDAPRLAYADWLDESGGEPERAALIRVQCELARRPPGDPRTADLMRAQEKLFRGRKLRWRASLPRFRGVVWGDFSRGFVDSLAVQTPNTFRRMSARIVEAIPLYALTIKPAPLIPAGMAGFGRTKALSQLSILKLPGQQMNDVRLGDLLDSPYLGRLSVLDLSLNHIGDGGARRLGACQTLPNLKVLNLSGNWLTEAGAQALAASEFAKRLDHLDLTANGFRPEAVETLRRALRDRYGIEWHPDWYPLPD